MSREKCKLGVLKILLLLIVVFITQISLAQEGLIEAAKIGDLNAVYSFIDVGVDVNSPDETGKTALIWAAIEGHIEIVQALVEEAEVDLDAQDADGRTALIWGSYRESYRCYQNSH